MRVCRPFKFLGSLVRLGHILVEGARRQARGLGTGTSGWERVVSENPCKHLALSEGMRGVGVTH